MSEDTRKLTGIAGNDNTTFISELCNSLSNITSFFIKNMELDGWLSESMGSVSETIKNLSVFVNNIEEIGLEIELIALNAQIKAARAGEKGAALSVLAEAIRTLSYSARNQTFSVTALLKNISDIASELINDSRDKKAYESTKTDDLMSITKNMQISLDSMHQNLHPLLVTLEEETNMLANSVTFLTGSITAHTKTNEVINDVCNGLKGLVSLALNTTKNDINNDNGNSSKYIKQLIEKYTMHSERNIHKSYFDKNISNENETSISGGLENYQKQNNNNDNFGDNVELF
jgi:hypothetical protein